MLFAICSDSHDNIVNIASFLNYCKKNKIDSIIHCGDVAEDETKKYFENNFADKIYFVEGNADISSELDKVRRTNRFQTIKRSPIPFLDLEFDNIRIAACHTKVKAARLAEKNIYHLVFYGHNHKPWQEKIGKTYVINPGNLAGMFYRASFAIYDTQLKKLELKILDVIS